jgi:hypothetical protein
VTEEKPKDSSSGFLAVDREQAIRENWDDIQNMARPATSGAGEIEEQLLIATYREVLNCNQEAHQLAKQAYELVKAENEKLVAALGDARRALIKIKNKCDHETELCECSTRMSIIAAEALVRTDQEETK